MCLTNLHSCLFVILLVFVRMIFVTTGRNWTLWTKRWTRYDRRSRTSWNTWNERRERIAWCPWQSSKCVDIQSCQLESASCSSFTVCQDWWGFNTHDLFIITLRCLREGNAVNPHMLHTFQAFYFLCGRQRQCANNPDKIIVLSEMYSSWKKSGTLWLSGKTLHLFAKLEEVIVKIQF